MKFIKKRAFTIVELLITISIIALILTVAIFSFGNTREDSRNSKRVSDIKQVQLALEKYHSDNGSYPTELNFGQPLSGNDGKIYMSNLPSNPSPRNDGDCPDSEYEYIYDAYEKTYQIIFCLSKDVETNLSAGEKMAIPAGIGNLIAWQCGNSYTDKRDNNVYKTVKINNQCWMAENLAYLPTVHNNTEFAAQSNNSQPGYGVYGYDGSDITAAKNQANYSTYGVLYNWFAVDQGNICPTGWHVPTDVEFKILGDYVDTYSAWTPGSGDPEDIGGEWPYAGTYLKEVGSTHWMSPNVPGTDSYGFTALPGGYRAPSFNYLTQRAFFWSSSEYPFENYCAPCSWVFSFLWYYSGINRDMYGQDHGLSVRCIKD
jgi:uncharacterized protein (TIGR02145 family)/prepilin-type N-terminal cleavage/methylation domain-containing protein